MSWEAFDDSDSEIQSKPSDVLDGPPLPPADHQQSAKKLCVLCKKEAVYKCGACKDPEHCYCSVNCAKDVWENAISFVTDIPHKETCSKRFFKK